MKTQQELMQAYWGPGGTVDMVKEYNAKHGCDVKPWECVRYNGKPTYQRHPDWHGSYDNYTFAVAILYDEKRKEHRPVFVGSDLYYKERLITVAGRMKGEDYLRDELLNSYETGILSWNPPTPKRTFKIGDMELPCPIKKVTEYTLEINAKDFGFWTFYFETNEEISDFLGSLIYAARDED